MLVDYCTCADVHVLNDGSQTPYAAIKALKGCGFTAEERGAGIDKYFFDSDMISLLEFESGPR